MSKKMEDVRSVLNEMEETEAVRQLWHDDRKIMGLLDAYDDHLKEADSKPINFNEYVHHWVNVDQEQIDVAREAAEHERKLAEDK